jgi:hypothetical protein
VPLPPSHVPSGGKHHHEMMRSLIQTIPRPQKYAADLICGGALTKLCQTHSCC